MTRGGYRPGAGRPKGSKNQRTVLLEEGAQKAAEGGLAPLDHLLAVMRDEDQPSNIRMDAAKAALPYCHAKLAPQHVTNDEAMSHEDWLELLEAD